MKVCNYLLNEFMTRVQRYETFVLKLASAVEGYRFDLPAFLPCYWAISMNVMKSNLSDSSNKNPELDSVEMQEVHSAAAFHYKKFTEDAHQWYLDHKSEFIGSHSVCC